MLPQLITKRKKQNKNSIINCIIDLS